MRLSYVLVGALFLPACAGSKPAPAVSSLEVAAATVRATTRATTRAKAMGTPRPAKNEIDAAPAPSLDLATGGAVHGEANGVPVELPRARIQGDDQGWYLILEQEPPTPGAEGPRYGWNQFHISLPEAPAPHKTMSRGLASGDGFFQVTDPSKADNGMGQSAINWQRSKNSWSIEFTKWDVRPWAPNAGEEQRAGTASGRVVLKLEDAGAGLKSSFVAGLFTDVPVSYVGTPPTAEAPRERARWISAAE